MADEAGENQSQDKQDANADALNNLADGTAADEQTQDEAPRDVLEPQNELPEALGDAVDAPDIDRADQTAELAEAMADAPRDAAPNPVAVRAARKASGVQFKRFVTPLLLVVGLALVAMSVYAWMQLQSSAGPDEYGVRTERTTLQENGPLLIGISLPLAGILLAAAWFFHRDVRRSDK